MYIKEGKSGMNIGRERERENMMDEEVVIVGGGIAGLATALALHRVGIRALVLERSPFLRATGAAFTLFPNAFRALDALGVAHKLTSRYPVREKAYVTNVATGAVQEISLIGTNGEGPITLHRKAVLESLAEELPTGSIRFSSNPVSIEAQDQEGPYTICLEDGTLITAKVLIGCDGVNSFVARKLGLTEPVNSGRSAIVAVSMFPEGHGVPDEMLQFVDAGTRAGVIPLGDKQICWFLTFNTPKEKAAMRRERDPKEILKEVTENYAKGFPPLYAQVVGQSDLSSLAWDSLKMRVPWDLILGKVSKGTMTVAGDAMHPMTPDLAHGGCSALEDAVVIGRHIGQSFIDNNGTLVPKAIAKALDNYVKERRWRAAWLIVGSYLSGWVQLGGDGWLTKILRDFVFYRLIFKKVLEIADYDCGKLPIPHDST